MSGTSASCPRSVPPNVHPDWIAILGAIACSLVAVPALVYYLLVVQQAPSATVAGPLALTPGVVMGTAALWLSARG